MLPFRIMKHDVIDEMDWFYFGVYQRPTRTGSRLKFSQAIDKHENMSDFCHRSSPVNIRAYLSL
jgi:hypothetical protein